MSNTIIQVNQELIHNEWKDLVRNSVEETLNALLDHEADQLVNAGKYERSGDRKGYRSGHYQRHFQTTSGVAIWALVDCFHILTGKLAPADGTGYTHAEKRDGQTRDNA